MKPAPQDDAAVLPRADDSLLFANKYAATGTFHSLNFGFLSGLIDDTKLPSALMLYEFSTLNP